jgi:hypothetical protein
MGYELKVDIRKELNVPHRISHSLVSIHLPGLPTTNDIPGERGIVSIDPLYSRGSNSSVACDPKELGCCDGW